MWLHRRRLRLLVRSAILLPLVATACSTSPTSKASCSGTTLPTRTSGTLTLSTGAITRSPWVVGPSSKEHANDPRLGKGYDAAIGYELATRLGFDHAHVRWIGLGFFDTLRPGVKTFDVGINQATITQARRLAVDMSSPYWVERQALVTIQGRELSKLTTLAQVRQASLVVVRDTPASRIPEMRTTPVDDLDEARRALTARGADGLVTDYNTGLRLDQTETELVGGEMVALLPAAAGADGFGLVLQKNSPLTSCVDDALGAMRDDGTLRRLEKRWLIDEQHLRELG